jgi:hypothetical protein
LGLLLNFNVALIKDGITRIANGMPDSSHAKPPSPQRKPRCSARTRIYLVGLRRSLVRSTNANLCWTYPSNLVPLGSGAVAPSVSLKQNPALTPGQVRARLMTTAYETFPPLRALGRIRHRHCSHRTGGSGSVACSRREFAAEDGEYQPSVRSTAGRCTCGPDCRSGTSRCPVSGKYRTSDTTLGTRFSRPVPAHKPAGPASFAWSSCRRS